MRKPSLKVLASALSLAFVAATTTEVSANHSWGGYHWARTANPFTLKLGENLNSTWEPILGTTSSDWSASSVLDTTVVTGGTTPKRCRPTSGQVQVCNERYGNNGWLGVAQIWASNLHITQGTVKVNDTYFNTQKYNTTAWRNLVMCQEVGHTLGLDHQDENFNNANLGTCMDYTNDPSSNQHPNQHDYDELVTIYSHLDSTSTLSASVQSAAAMPREMVDNEYDQRRDWGQLLKRSKNGLKEVYMLDFGHGYRLFTFVRWAEGENRR